MNPHRALSHGGIYAGNPPDNILGERSWVIEWWRQEYRACSNRYLDCTNLCESLGFRCRGSTTPLEPKYLSLDTWRRSEGQFDFTHITSYPSFTAQRGIDSHLCFLPQGKGRAWEWMASLHRWVECCLRRLCLSHPMQSPESGVGGKSLGEQQMGLSEGVKGNRMLLLCFKLQQEALGCLWDVLPVDFPQLVHIHPQHYMDLAHSHPVASSLCELLMVTESMNYDRWLLSVCRKPVGQGEATNFSFIATLGRTNGRILGEHRSLGILPKEQTSWSRNSLSCSKIHRWPSGTW